MEAMGQCGGRGAAWGPWGGVGAVGHLAVLWRTAQGLPAPGRVRESCQLHSSAPTAVPLGRELQVGSGTSFCGCFTPPRASERSPRHVPAMFQQPWQLSLGRVSLAARVAQQWRG